jgi:S1-C subfamily serine protease
MGGAILGGSVVAGVFAIILVAGIWLILRTNRSSPPAAVQNQSAPVESMSSATSSEPLAAPPQGKAGDPVAEPVSPNPSGPGEGGLTAEVRDRVKKATVYLRVTLDQGRVAEGSGFFAVDQGVVVTNAHVVGMLVGKTRRPQRVAVVLSSGQADERTLAGQILEVDRSSDLAVIRVSGANLPDPLAVHEAKNLQETQEVFVCGFPLGTNLGKEISIRKSSVAALRRENGELVRLQLEGGMDPGNSGGPVIDTRGRVVGVAVAGIRGTTINFAIPGEKVNSILAGRVSRISLGQPYRDGTKVLLPLTVHVVDPLDRLQQVVLESWTGNPGEARPPSPARPAAFAGDSPRQQHTFNPKAGSASGAIELPPVPQGKVHWFQPVAGSAGKQQWSSAVPWTSPPAAIDRKPVALGIKHRAGLKQPVDLTTTTRIRMEQEGSDHLLAIDLDGQLSENVVAVDGQGTAAVQLGYLKMNMGVSFDGKPSARTAQMQQTLGLVNQLLGDLRVDRQGNVVQNRIDLSKVPAQARPALIPIGEQVQQMFEVLTVPLPGGQVKPGDFWTGQRVLPIDSGGRYDAGVMDMQYIFLGVRTQNGRDEAVIELKGNVRPGQGGRQYVNGRTTGTAVVDVATGLVTTAAANIDVDLDLSVNGQLTRADSELTLRLQRTAPQN